MIKISEPLKKLANNPNSMSLGAVMRELKNSEESLKYVLGEELIRVVKNTSYSGKLPASINFDEYVLEGVGEIDFTKVFFWGLPGCGKSTVIGSLLGCLAEENLFTDDDKRSVMQRETFSKEDQYITLPFDRDEGPKTEVAKVVVRRKSWYGSKTYPITFIEGQLGEDGSIDETATNYLNKRGEQIHILCLDCSGNATKQGNAFRTLLDFLDRNNFIKRTNGVFVLVTKSDMMYRVPRDYREKAAQTMVTAGQKIVWQRVRNICYDKGILGATPIVYNVGDVKLKTLVKLDLTMAKRLWVETIIGKSRPLLTWLQKIMNWGGKKLTIPLFVIFLAAALYGIYSVLKPDVLPPNNTNLPIDYKDLFFKRVSTTIEGHGYYECKSTFEKECADLDLEYSIKAKDGSQVLSDDDNNECDAKLCNTFAGILYKEGTDHLSRSVWNDDQLKSLFWTAKKVLNRRVDYDNRADLNSFTSDVDTYFRKVKPLITLSKNCTSLANVKKVYNDVGKYKMAPFTNNDRLYSDLNNAVSNSEESYANSLLSRAKRIHCKYNGTYGYNNRKYYNRDRDYVRGLIKDFEDWEPSDDVKQTLNEAWYEMEYVYFR